jgi:hypothetical protein
MLSGNKMTKKPNTTQEYVAIKYREVGAKAMKLLVEDYIRFQQVVLKA